MHSLRASQSIRSLLPITTHHLTRTTRSIRIRNMSTSDVSTYTFNHTQFRIKDPKITIPFYEKVLGFELIREAGGSDFTNFFLALPQAWGGEKLTKEQKVETMFERQGILELCWNHGTENDPEFKYHNGNEEPHRGFGHIAITVDSLEGAVKRFDELGVKFKKRPEDGRMRHIAFILDPDSYWIEILEKQRDVPHK